VNTMNDAIPTQNHQSITT